MNVKKHIFLASPHMSKEGFEKEYVKEAFETNWIAPVGANVNGFEKEMAEKIGAKATVSLASGTAAIHMALLLLGVGEGDVVFSSSLTFAATANPIKYQGATPVFIDSEKDTWNISPVALERAFKKYLAIGKKPKAVIFAHLYGISANLDEIIKICKKYDCPIIEDAAESLGTKYRGECTNGEWQYTGTFGDYGIISFNGNKIITSSGGGMLVCNTEDAIQKAAKAKFLASQAKEEARWYQHNEFGYNYRMSNIVAGIGRGQLKVLDERVNKKREIFDYYKNNIGQLRGLTLMPADSEYGFSNCWLSVIQLDEQATNKSGTQITIDSILDALNEDDIEGRPVWKPLHLQPVFKGCDFVAENEEAESFTIINERMYADTSNSGQLFSGGVCLPSDTKMDEEDLERVCGVIKKLWD